MEAENVHLLADELSQGDTAEGDAANESQQILKNYLVKKDQAETDDHYIYQYLDLVDETNGRAWVTADRPVDVYWKLPKGSDSNDDFKLVHFTGLDRQYDEETEGLIGQEGYEVEAYTTSNGGLEIVTLDGEQYLKFATKEFSPFVLVWDEVSNSSGGGNKPSLNTEDHYGYIVGYPVDYETGEPTDDQARKPVKPQGKITRAEVATIFFRMLTDESRNEYSEPEQRLHLDVAADAWYNNAISTMANAGILDGYEDGSFHPNGYITRAEFATHRGAVLRPELPGRGPLPGH
ncbi:MAG: S-layer homology domain-containing protein [Evtepia gabavorous]